MRRVPTVARAASEGGLAAIAFPFRFHMNEITVTLPDGSSRRMPAGTTPGGVAAAISPRLAKAAIAAAVDGRLVDLSCPIQADARVRVITPEGAEALHVYRHSTAHL